MLINDKAQMTRIDELTRANRVNIWIQKACIWYKSQNRTKNQHQKETDEIIQTTTIHFGHGYKLKGCENQV